MAEAAAPAKKDPKGKKRNYQFLEMLPVRVDHALRVRVQHLVLKRQVEFRILPEGAPTHCVELFFQELHELTNLDHPAFMPILERGMIRGSHCFTVPLRFHEPLTTQLEEPTFRVEERCLALRSLASALCAAHMEKFVLGSLNPELVAWDPIAGAAYFLHHRSSQAIASPIVSRSLPKDVRQGGAKTAGDVYYWGQLAYWLLSKGRLPCQGNVPILELAPNLDRRFAATIMTCLSEEPEKRPHDGAELNTLLQLDPKNLSPDESEGDEGQVVEINRDLSLSEFGVVLTEKLQQLRNTGAIPVARPLPEPDPESTPDHSLPDELADDLGFGQGAPSPEEEPELPGSAESLMSMPPLPNTAETPAVTPEQVEAEAEDGNGEAGPGSSSKRRPMPSGALQVAMPPPKPPKLPRPSEDTPPEPEPLEKQRRSPSLLEGLVVGFVFGFAVGGWFFYLAGGPPPAEPGNPMRPAPTRPRDPSDNPTPTRDPDEPEVLGIMPLPPSTQTRFKKNPFIRKLLRLQKVGPGDFEENWKTIRFLALRKQLPEQIGERRRVVGMREAFEINAPAGLAKLEEFLRDLRTLLGPAEEEP